MSWNWEVSIERYRLCTPWLLVQDHLASRWLLWLLWARKLLVLYGNRNRDKPGRNQWWPPQQQQWIPWLLEHLWVTRVSEKQQNHLEREERERSRRYGRGGVLNAEGISTFSLYTKAKEMTVSGGTAIIPKPYCFTNIWRVPPPYGFSLKDNPRFLFSPLGNTGLYPFSISWKCSLFGAKGPRALPCSLPFP